MCYRNKIEVQLSRLLKDDGPSNKFQFWNMGSLKKKAATEYQNEDLMKKMQLVKEEMRQQGHDWVKFCNEMSKDLDDLVLFQDSKRMWRYKQILWIWFLTEPLKVLKATKTIKAEAQKQVQPNTEKVVSGLLRRGNWTESYILYVEFAWILPTIKMNKIHII